MGIIYKDSGLPTGKGDWHSITQTGHGLAKGLNALPLCHHKRDGKVGGTDSWQSCEVPRGLKDAEKGTWTWPALSPSHLRELCPIQGILAVTGWWGKLLVWDPEEMKLFKLELDLSYHRRPHGLLLSSMCNSTTTPASSTGHKRIGDEPAILFPTQTGAYCNPVLTLTTRRSIRHYRFKDLVLSNTVLPSDTSCMWGLQATHNFDWLATILGLPTTPSDSMIP